MRKYILYFVVINCLLLSGCFTTLGLSNSIRINPEINFNKEHTILIKKREIDRLDFGVKIAKFFKDSGYKVILSEKENPADYELLYEYFYNYDVFHNTLDSLDIIVRDMKSKNILVDAHFQAFSPLSADTLLKSYLKDILEKLERK